MVRHGFTNGNYKRQYVGVTDEPLSKKGKLVLYQSIDKEIKIVYVSPMRRTRETAEILFPNAQQIVVDGLREMNFGDFEMKNYEDLKENKEYRKWVDSNCEGEIPNGEKKCDFTKRSCKAFDEAVKHAFEGKKEKIAIVAHGGTIMSILSEYAHPKCNYFDCKTPNGKFWVVVAKKEEWDSRKTLYIKKSPKED